MLGVIQSIEEFENFRVAPAAEEPQKGGRSGLSQIADYPVDGYKVVTDKHTFYVLIASYQSCCGDSGYLSSEDVLSNYIGSLLLEVNLTDTALNNQVLEESEYRDYGGIQFVDFVTNTGVFQLAVYNYYNGFYGQDILVAKDEDLMLYETL